MVEVRGWASIQPNVQKIFRLRMDLAIIGTVSRRIGFLGLGFRIRFWKCFWKSLHIAASSMRIVGLWNALDLACDRVYIFRDLHFFPQVRSGNIRVMFCLLVGLAFRQRRYRYMSQE